MTQTVFLDAIIAMITRRGLSPSAETYLSGTSIDSVYIPLFAKRTPSGEVLLHEKRRVCIYTLPISNTMDNKLRSTTESTGVCTKYIFSTTPKGFHNAGLVFGGFCGTLAEYESLLQPTVLFSLTVKRENYWKFLTNPTIEALVLVVRRELLTEKKYSTLRSKLKPFFSVLELLNVNFLLVNNINNVCFNTPTDLPTFTTIGDKLKYLSDLHNFIPKAIPKEPVKPIETDAQKRQRLANQAQNLLQEVGITYSGSTETSDFTNYA